MPLELINSALFVTIRAEQYLPGQATTATAARIVKAIAPISADTAINSVMELFQQNRDLTILPLVDNKRASGIMYRDSFLSKLFSSRYGIELYGKKPISSFIDHLPFFVDQNTPIAEVSKSLTSAMRNEQAFIITNNGEFAGIGTLLDLLEYITQQQIHHAKHANPLTLLPGSVPFNDKINQLLTNNAKHANPLTLLPGSVPFNEKINQLLVNKSVFSIGYFDLDNFKPFNDVYSYSAGDDIIKAVANLLTQQILPEDGQVGHIGGDDFIVIFTCADWLVRCEAILRSFECIVPTYYKTEDVKSGGIHAEGRNGEKCFFPLISLSVGLISPEATVQCNSHVEIADLASAAKKMAKKIPGNSFFVEQRLSKNQHDESCCC